MDNCILQRNRSGKKTGVIKSKYIEVSRGGRAFTSLVFGMGQMSEEGVTKKIAQQISMIAFHAPHLLHMEKEFALLQEAALEAFRQVYPNREHFLKK